MKLRSIYLENFRSYNKLRLNINKSNFVILTGRNGTGKTNLLEALSFLAPGKGFRNSKLDDILKKDSSSKHWLIHSQIEDGKKKYEIGIGCYINKFNTPKKNENKKIIKIDGKQIKRQSELPNILSLIWLIPEMDIFFRTSSSVRRKFLDRFIFNLKPDYLITIRNYEKNLKERYRLLTNITFNNFSYKEGEDLKLDSWLTKIEEKLVTDGITIFVERKKFIEKFNSLPIHSKSFPKIKLFLHGNIEKILISENEENGKIKYLNKIRKSRKIDSIKGSISYGPNKSDLKTLYIKKNITADKCSTGEQKIILIAVIIQFCKLLKIKKGNSPILLLDELVTHLDEKIKLSLFEELKNLNSQVWMSGSDKSLFKSIYNEAEKFEIGQNIKQ